MKIRNYTTAAILAAWLIVQATAYSPDDCPGRTTATGTTPKFGTVSVDPRVIPLGSQVTIEGVGVFTAEDTGGAIKGNRVDMWLPNGEWAKRWGRREVRVKV